jgi:coenzyme Q-binding protein COQ10
LPSHSESRVLPYTADVMYGIVADVEKYPEFLPWCRAVRVVKRCGSNEMDVEMLVGFGAFNERYTSRVIANQSAGAVDVTQVDGPFRRLETHWRIAPSGNSCKVDFLIAFEFKSTLLNTVAGNAFGRVLVTMTDAFEKRARALSVRQA